MEDIDGKVSIEIPIRKGEAMPEIFYFIIYEWRRLEPMKINRPKSYSKWVKAYAATKEHPVEWLIYHREHYPDEEKNILFYSEINMELADKVNTHLA